VIQLPWKPDVAWVAADCVMEGKEVEQAPRNVLKKLIAEAAEAGLRVKTGVEAEFFLITPEGDGDFRSLRYRRKALLRPAGGDAPL
jgi:glutamine synthetase